MPRNKLIRARLVRAALVLAALMTVLCTGYLCAGASDTFSLTFSGEETVIGYTGTPPATLEIPHGIKHIRNNSFKGCTEIKTLILPDSIEDIGSWAFSDTGITSVIIGSEIKDIGKGAFAKCKYLSEIVIRPRSSLGETRIENEAFRDCTSLTQITIPDTVTYIGQAAFHSCTSLREVVNGTRINELGNNCFRNCTELAIAPFGPSLRIIGNNCFQNCPRIQDVVLPDCIEEVGSWAFAQSGITSIVVGSSIREIRSDAFAECNYLNNVDIRVPAGQSQLKIERAAFRDCPSLTRITIPDTVTYVGTAAFKDCSNLVSVTIGANVEELGNECFENCAELSSVSFGQSLRAIGNECFRDCYKLRNVVLPDRVEEIGTGSFANSGITDIILGKHLQIIGHDAFFGCEYLKNVAFRVPDFRSEIEIRVGAFNGCSSLETLYLPAIVKHISRNVFDKSGVREIFFGGTSAQWEIATKDAKIPSNITVQFDVSAPDVPDAPIPAASSTTSPVLPGAATRPPEPAETVAPAPTAVPTPTTSTVPSPLPVQPTSTALPGENPTSSDSPAPSTEPSHDNRPGLAPGSGLEISESRDGLILTGITAGSDRAYTDVNHILDDLHAPSGCTIRIVDAQSRPCSGTAPVATGDRILVTDAKGNTRTITIVVRGDVCGTGKMSIRQVVALARAFTGAAPLTGPYLLAGDLNDSNKIDIGDIVKEAQLLALSMYLE